MLIYHNSMHNLMGDHPWYSLSILAISVLFWMPIGSGNIQMQKENPIYAGLARGIRRRNYSFSFYSGVIEKLSAAKM
ncbi:hypothetical protein [Pedobacter sp. KLB.chiD]|uniref:hypothetical protein n=1 Tax=Pedobacter sp. KLB.chiD TaxID=3387402 RepID=UPI00399A0D1D